MKKTMIFLTLFFLIGMVFCSLAFASGGMELNITNRTSSEIHVIKIYDIAEKNEKEYPVLLSNGESIKIKVIKDKSYNIVLICANNHKYGVQNIKISKKSNEIEILNRHYIFEDLGSFLRRVFPFLER